MPSLRLDPELRNVATARDFVAQSVEGRVADMDDVLVMVSELVTNVVRHTGSEVTLTVRVGPPVRIEVHDGEAATEAFREIIQTAPSPQLTVDTGRGLSIVHALAERIGLDDDPDGGKVVWFEV